MRKLIQIRIVHSPAYMGSVKDGLIDTILCGLAPSESIPVYRISVAEQNN